MQIRVGYELVYDCPQPTPMLLMLNVHYTRVSDMVVPDHLVASPSTRIRGYRDGFGNWCNRFVAPAGRIRLSAAAIVNDTGEPDRVASGAQQHSVAELPDEVFVFLLGSRYCETDRLSEIAWSLFGNTPLGWSRVQAICDYVHQHLAFGYEHARAIRTAWEAYCDRTGVCRGSCAPRGRSLPLHEHPGAVLPGLSGRYRRPGLGRADGFLSLVRSLSRRRLVHVRRTPQRPAHL